MGRLQPIADSQEPFDTTFWSVDNACRACSNPVGQKPGHSPFNDGQVDAHILI